MRSLWLYILTFRSGLINNSDNPVLRYSTLLQIYGKDETYSLSEMEDKYIGKTGTPKRNEYEYELRNIQIQPPQGEQ